MLLRAAPVVLAAGVLLAPQLARACSCMSIAHPTLERCRTASRAFSGTVAAYEWPTAYRATADNSVAIELAVEAVWRGAVPERVIVKTHPLGGPGSCAIYPRPGEHFLICDGRDGAAQPAFSFCDGPSFAERADMLVRALGPSARPTAPSPPRWPWWTDRAQLAESEEALLLLAFPFTVALLGAGLGVLTSRRRPALERLSIRRLVVIVLAVVVLVIVTRFVLHLYLPPQRLLFLCVTLGPSAFAALFGAFFGFSTQRRGRRGLRGLAVALLGTAVVLTAGYIRLHAPVQPEDAVTCSEARAAAHLRAFPRPENPELRDIERDRWERDAPAACTDWGLARMSATREGPAIGFADGHGGMHWIRGVEGSSRSYTWELP